MKIMHIPNRTNPYEYNQYGREPEFIISGDKVEVNCYISSCNKEKHKPTLIYCIDGQGEVEIEGIYQHSKENRDYYTFHLGAFHTAEVVRYAIKAMESNQEVQTKWYEFEVLSKYECNAPDEVYIEELMNSSILQCYYFIKDDIRLNLSIALAEDTISIQTKLIETNNNNHKYMDKNYYEYKGKQYCLKMDFNPFSIKVLNKNQDTLVSYNEEIHNIVLLFDKRYKGHHLTFSSNCFGKAFYGFGEKYNKVNQRGLSPKSCVVEQFTHQQEKTYLPMPYFITEKGYGLYYDTNHIVDFEIKEMEDEKNVLTVNTIIGNNESKDKVILLFGTIKEMLEQYINMVGELKLPPRWAFGPWMSGNGWDTQKETLEQVNNMKQYKIPATVLVLEAWSDEATFYIFNGAKYEPKDGSNAFELKDFTFTEEAKWPNPKEMSDIIHENNLKLILWQIPVIKQTDIHESKQHLNDIETVLSNGFHVKQSDGTPYEVTDNWFADSLLLDFNNKEAVKWWFSKREYLVDELQVDGFKTDGGEFVYDYQTLFYDGKSGYEMKNLYPNSYVSSYYNFLEDKLGKGKGITFSRAGYTGAGSFPMHWAGDQVSEFSELRSQIRAGLSAGLSGVFFWGFDLAGFAGELPTTELYLRATALSAFCPVMQFHSEPRTGQFGDARRRSYNNDRTPWNIAAVNKDEYVMDVYRYYANLRMNLLPYIYNEAKNSIKEYRPLFCHLIYDYRDDGNIFEIEDEYMFGRSLLVAPVVYEGEIERNVYLPTGVWYDFFTRMRYEGGRIYKMSCEIGKILVFVKEGSLIPLNLSSKHELGCYVGNDVSSYDKLCFFAYGEKGECHYKDEFGNNIVAQYSDGKIKIKGDGSLNTIKIYS